MKEKLIYKDIPGYEGLYQAISVGYIKSVIGDNTIGTRNRKSTRKVIVLCGWISEKGYKKVGLVNHKGVRKMFKVHRLIALAFVPNPENKPEVNHKDGNKLNNNYTNLEWSTRSENVKHAYDLGLYDNKLKNKK